VIEDGEDAGRKPSFVTLSSRRGSSRRGGFEEAPLEPEVLAEEARLSSPASISRT